MDSAATSSGQNISTEADNGMEILSASSRTKCMLHYLCMVLVYLSCNSFYKQKYVLLAYLDYGRGTRKLKKGIVTLSGTKITYKNTNVQTQN